MNSTTIAHARISMGGIIPRHKLNRRLLLSSAAIALLATPVAHANPKDGTVSTGSASISTSSSKTTIDQKSQGVVIDWSSFNIGNGQTTQFVQPNSSAIAVNRIGSASASQILGTLDANGRVVLINGNGMLFGKNSQVNVGSLIATSTDGSDSDLLNGKFNNAGNQNASIVNRGTITTANRGIVALVAPNVTNTGTVRARLGTVALGAANEFTVDFAGDGLVSFATQGDVNGKAIATNTGRLTSANVLMTARAAEGLATGVVNVKGVIQAQSVHQVGGSIVLDAGDGGSIDVTGAKLNASGNLGGGSISVGGWNQSSIIVDKNSVMSASAIKSGNGGTINVAAAATSFEGRALANGGVLAGNGGNIETSGHVLDVSGAWISTTAAHGKTGDWLLDPENVTITDNTTANGGFDGGSPTNTFRPTGDNSIVSTTDLENALATTNVTITTGSVGSQAGDITVASALTWGSTSTLTLDAYHSINIDAGITLTGAGGVDLITNDGGTGGVLSFGLTSSGFAGNIAYTYVNPVSGTVYGSLTINGNPYELVYDPSGLESDISANAGAYIALADSYDGSGDPVSGSDFSPYTFSGTFEGLGNTMSGERFNDTFETNVGMFGTIGAGGIVRDLALSNFSVTSSVAGANVGILAGLNSGTIMDVTVTGTVTGNQDSEMIGGLVGTNSSAISYSSAAVAVSTESFAFAGGLAGENTGTIMNSSASGSVTASFDSQFGGLVGNNANIIAYSYATGATCCGDSSSEGGLVGLNAGTISYSYATGNNGDTVDTENSDVGGLVGDNTGTINYSYATGSIVGGPGNFEGGLIGYNNGGTVSYAYSYGAVTGGQNATVGGLIGNNIGTVTQTYSTGAVLDTQTGAIIGGLIGEDDAISGGVTYSYWDTDTSGITSLSQGAGNVANDSGITGMATTALQGSLPTGFDNTVWGTGPGLYPYFLWQYPTGTPQFVTGTAYTDTGNTLDVGDTITGLVDGNSIGTAASGANGYYYFLVAPGSFSGTDAVYVQSATGASVADDLAASPTGVDIWGNYLRDTTGESDLFFASYNADVAIGFNNAAITFANSLTNEYIVSSAPSFAVDGGLVDHGSTTVKTTNGDIYVDSQQDWYTSGTLTFDSSGSIYVRQPIEIESGANLAFVTSDGGTGNLVFQGGNAFFTDPPNSNLTINGQAYTLVPDIATLASDITANASGFYALANNYDASADGTYVHAPIPTTFTGTFEGLGNTIANLAVNSADSELGFFAVNQGNIENLELANLSVTGTAGSADVGGLVGFNQGGTILSSSVMGNVTSVGIDGNLGGFAGHNSGTIDTSEFNGAVDDLGNNSAGGFVGFNDNGGVISRSNALGTLAASGWGGGFAASNVGNIDNSYTTVAVTGGGNSIAGFTVLNFGSITDSYASGVLTGASSGAGFVVTNDGTLTGDAWDKDTTGDNSADSPGLTGLDSTTAYSQSTYTALGWTFGAGGDWYMIDGETRPFLQAEYSTNITNAHQLQLMSMDLTEQYSLANDVTYDGTMWASTGFVPVGNLATPFEGTFNGQGYTIHNLTIDQPTQDYVGLFGDACDCTDISNVTLQGGSVTGKDYVGALAGATEGSMSYDFSDVNVTGAYDPTALTNGNFVGGLVGDYEGSGLFYSSSSGNVTGAFDVGGLVGLAGYNAIIQFSTASGNVQGLAGAGGLIGNNDGTVVDASASGNVSGAPVGTSRFQVTGLGGLIGVNESDGEVIESSATGSVVAPVTNGLAADSTGGFVGLNGGEIFASWSTGSVSGGFEAGGFVGENDGFIDQSFATGSAQGIEYVGGLAGYNGELIQDSYAMGAAAVTASSGGSDGFVGGLVGENDGDIDHTYSTGMVTCTTSDACAGTLGGLVGVNNGPINAKSFFDVDTSGIAATDGIGTNNHGNGSNVAGETTTTLQAGLYSTWGHSTWGILRGVSYPYLQWQTGGEAPQVVSGTIAGSISGENVGLLVDGISTDPLVSMSSGANGYYYLLLAPGTLSDSQVLAYLTSGTPGNAYAESGTKSLSNLEIQEGELRVRSTAADTAAIFTDLDEALGGSSGAQFLYSMADGFVPNTNLYINDTNSDFTIDSSIDLGAGDLVLLGKGSIAQTDGTITAGDLIGSSVGGASLIDDNAIATLGSFVNRGTGGFALTDEASLKVNGSVNAGTGALALTTIGTGSNLTIYKNLTAGGVATLESAGSLWQKATSIITAATLTGSTAGATRLQGANLITDLGDFTDTTGSFELTDNQALNVTGTVNTGSGNLGLLTTAGDLDISGALDGGSISLVSNLGEVYGTGAITANFLTVSADTGIDLDGSSNDINRIGRHTTTTGPNTIDNP